MSEISSYARLIRVIAENFLLSDAKKGAAAPVDDSSTLATAPCLSNKIYAVIKQAR